MITKERENVKYAIDRYSIGVETEVSASDFEGQCYIPRRRNRFYCPECGEIVFFRDRGGNHPSQFYHQEKTERTPECDRRVDGRSELSLSQRVGLHIYLTGTISGQFQLNIGFPALGQQMLEKAIKAGCTVEISGENQRRMVKVDYANFIYDSVTLVPINFIPPGGRNYLITIFGAKPIFGLKRKWSDYADGFEIDGAIFSYDETGGKKIRRGDSISTNRSYYAVIKNKFPPYLQIYEQTVGELVIGKDSYRVLKIKITVSLEDKESFSAISAYFKRHFGVWLLELQPELIPIWPPVVQQDCFIPVKPESAVLCAISSGNTNPSVYVYTDYGVQKKELHHDFGKVNTVEVIVGRKPVSLSVDRKYVGRETVFFVKKPLKGNYEYDYRAVSESNYPVSWDVISDSVLSKEFFFETNSRLELYLGCKDRTYRHISLRKKITEIPAREGTNEIYLLAGMRVIYHIRYDAIRKQRWNEDGVQNLLKVVQKGIMMPIPRWADFYIRELGKSGDRKMYEIAKAVIVNGQIHAEALHQLRLLYVENIKWINKREKEG